MNKTDACILVGIVAFAAVLYSAYDARNEIASQKVILEISRTIENISDRENINISSAKYMTGNFTIGAENETDFMQKVRENEIKTIYLDFEEANDKLTKKYWGILANGALEFKQNYMPVKETYLFGWQSGIMVFEIRSYDSENVTFEKNSPIFYYLLYAFLAVSLGFMAGTLAFCLSFVPSFIAVLIATIFGK